MSRVPALRNAHLDDPVAKRDFNRRHFATAAPRYDMVTKVLSLGGDGVWKRRLIAALPAQADTCLDLACGTGDLCFLLADRFPQARIEGIDLSQEMLSVADRRNLRGDRIRLSVGDMGALPQADASMDVVTGGYALRNAPTLETALQEVYRVLKPGGSAAFLDFSKSPAVASQRVQAGVMRFWGGLWGLLLHGNPAVHGYIAASLRSYPTRPQLTELLRATGFELSASHLFYGGMTELTLLKKP
jgi:ubiquinone/menaquinone biosynthesis methyltransferase